MYAQVVYTCVDQHRSAKETATLTKAADSIDSGRAARLEARVSRTRKCLVQRAVALSGRTLSEYVVASAQAAATKVIRVHDTIQLPQAEQSAFVKTLLSRPARGCCRLQEASRALGCALRRA